MTDPELIAKELALIETVFGSSKPSAVRPKSRVMSVQSALSSTRFKL